MEKRIFHLNLTTVDGEYLDSWKLVIHADAECGDEYNLTKRVACADLLDNIRAEMHQHLDHYSTFTAAK